MLVNFQCRDVLQTRTKIGQGSTALAVGAGERCLDTFSFIYLFSPLSPSWRRSYTDLNTVSQWAVKPKTTNKLGPATYFICPSAEQLSFGGLSTSMCT